MAQFQHAVYFVIIVNKISKSLIFFYYYFFTFFTFIYFSNFVIPQIRPTPFNHITVPHIELNYDFLQKKIILTQPIPKGVWNLPHKLNLLLITGINLYVERYCLKTVWSILLWEKNVHICESINYDQTNDSKCFLSQLANLIVWCTAISSNIQKSYTI